MENNDKQFSFIKTYKSLAEVLTDHKLASLGDSYINFAYSIALSNRKKQPSGAKVKGQTLAEAFKKAGLREFMPSRTTRHMMADAAEALIVYAWLQNHITIAECVAILEKGDDPTTGLFQLLTTIKNRITF